MSGRASKRVEKVSFWYSFIVTCACDVCCAGTAGSAANSDRGWHHSRSDRSGRMACILCRCGKYAVRGWSVCVKSTFPWGLSNGFTRGRFHEAVSKVSDWLKRRQFFNMSFIVMTRDVSKHNGWLKDTQCLNIASILVTLLVSKSSF